MRLIATDLGVDVLCAAEDTEPVAAALIAAGAVPATEARLRDPPGRDAAGRATAPTSTTR